MENINEKWKTIWEKREIDANAISDLDDIKNVFMELKRCDGFDVLAEGLSYEALYDQYLETKSRLFVKEDKYYTEKSVFEVGCGCGANLFLFERDGYKTGGADYSKQLIDIAAQVLNSSDISCCEAKDIAETPQYDVCLSNSVFSYFPDYEYAWQVLSLMYDKARYSIGLIDIHDKARQHDFIEYRRRTVENYEERYKDLHKFFYEREFFEKFAANHDMDITFVESNMEGYWNNEFVFNCYLYKKG